MRVLWLAIGLGLVTAPSGAVEVDANLVAEMRQRLDAQEQRIQQLEARLGAAIAPRPSPDVSTVTFPNRASPATAQAVVAIDRFRMSGDLRLRHESNFGEAGVRRRDREVLRARVRGVYQAADWLTAGGQIVIGDPDDPNSTDATLSGFDDDLPVSLDQAYLHARAGRLEGFGGKFPLPFMRTDLVWDGDVSPQGGALSYSSRLNDSLSLKASGLYFTVDESAGGPNSEMLGAQLSMATAQAAAWRVEAAVGYYDYRLSSLVGADAGDFRTNLLTPGGRYLSDFDLIDVIASVTYAGLGDRWPIRITTDYVRNLGAATAEDSGFSTDVVVGRLTDRHDWRIAYGYSEADADAVLAAFSHDNTAIATNYIQHSFAIDYLLARNLLLNATYYHYREKSALGSAIPNSLDWRDRLRLQLMVSF